MGILITFIFFKFIRPFCAFEYISINNNFLCVMIIIIEIVAIYLHKSKAVNYKQERQTAFKSLYSIYFIPHEGRHSISGALNNLLYSSFGKRFILKCFKCIIPVIVNVTQLLQLTVAYCAVLLQWIFYINCSVLSQ